MICLFVLSRADLCVQMYIKVNILHGKLIAFIRSYKQKSIVLRILKLIDERTITTTTTRELFDEKASER